MRLIRVIFSFILAGAAWILFSFTGLLPDAWSCQKLHVRMESILDRTGFTWSNIEKGLLEEKCVPAGAFDELQKDFTSVKIDNWYENGVYYFVHPDSQSTFTYDPDSQLAPQKLNNALSIPGRYGSDAGKYSILVYPYSEEEEQSAQVRVLDRTPMDTEILWAEEARSYRELGRLLEKSQTEAISIKDLAFLLQFRASGRFLTFDPENHIMVVRVPAGRKIWEDGDAYKFNKTPTDNSILATTDNPFIKLMDPQGPQFITDYERCFVWNTQTDEITLLGCVPEGTLFRFSPDGRKLVMTGENENGHLIIYVVDPAAQQTLDIIYLDAAASEKMWGRAAGDKVLLWSLRTDGNDFFYDLTNHAGIKYTETDEIAYVMGTEEYSRVHKETRNGEIWLVADTMSYEDNLAQIEKDLQEGQ